MLPALIASTVLMAPGPEALDRLTAFLSASGSISLAFDLEFGEPGKPPSVRGKGEVLVGPDRKLIYRIEGVEGFSEFRQNGFRSIVRDKGDLTYVEYEPVRGRGLPPLAAPPLLFSYPALITDLSGEALKQMDWKPTADGVEAKFGPPQGGPGGPPDGSTPPPGTGAPPDPDSGGKPPEMRTPPGAPAMGAVFRLSVSASGAPASLFTEVVGEVSYRTKLTFTRTSNAALSPSVFDVEPPIGWMPYFVRRTTSPVSPGLPVDGRPFWDGNSGRSIDAKSLASGGSVALVFLADDCPASALLRADLPAIKQKLGIKVLTVQMGAKGGDLWDERREFERLFGIFQTPHIIRFRRDLLVESAYSGYAKGDGDAVVKTLKDIVTEAMPQ